MITKEKLLNGYIKNDHGELRKKFVEAAEFHGFDTEWMGYDIKYLTGDYVFIDEEGTVDGGLWSHLPLPQEELTLNDFTESPKNDTGGVSKWKYNLVNMEDCLFGLKDKYTNDKLYVLYEGEYLKVGNQTQLAEGFITNTLFTREEIKWQDEVSDYVLKEGIPYSCDGRKHIKALSEYTDEQFLEICRIAMRSTGELK